MNDTFKLKGAVHILVRNAEGYITHDFHKDNLIVTIGKTALMAYLALGTQSAAFMPYTAVGTGTSSPSSSDTALQTELARVANSCSASANVLSLNASYGPGVAVGAVTEAGLFDAASAGNMFSHVVFSPVNVLAGDTLNVNWSVTGS